MHLVPQHAIIDEESQTTFADLRQEMVLSKQDVQQNNVPKPSRSGISLGCGSHDVARQVTPATEVQRRRRLIMLDAASVWNHATKMGLRDMP